MKCPSRLPSRHPRLACIVTLAAATLLGAASAADMPKRKPGLWEVNAQMAGMPSAGPMQQCIDQTTDDLMQQRASAQKQNCSVIEIKPQGNRVSVHSVCKVQNSTATTDAVFVGAFDSAYKGDMLTRFNPPLNGLSESKVNIDARWLGPCKPGQKPGDVVMPNVGGMNVNEMMKDPRVQEMMKRQK